MKVDFKKTIPSYRSKRDQFQIIDVPPMQFLAIDGCNGPAAPAFTAAIAALYPLAYKLKFMSKLELDRDYVVPPLEALWWADDMSVFTLNYDQSQWDWSAMIMVPDWVTRTMFEDAHAVTAKKKPGLVGLDSVRWRNLNEGRCVQTLHVGPYSAEGPVLRAMHTEFIVENDLQMSGKHHEIYFNDFRKTAPEKLRTILRQPVIAASG